MFSIWSWTGPVLGPCPCLNSVFSPGRSGPVLDRFTALKRTKDVNSNRKTWKLNSITYPNLPYEKRATNLVLSRNKKVLLLQCVNGRILRSCFNLKTIYSVIRLKEIKITEKLKKSCSSSYFGIGHSYLTFTGFLKHALWSFRTCRPQGVI